MVLSDKEIRSGQFVTITPFEDELVNPNSYDVKIGDLLLEVNPTGKAIDFNEKKDVDVKRLEIGRKGLVLYPNRVYLAAITSHTTYHNCAGMVKAKSSCGRIGLEVCVDAGWVDTGFKGYLTLELNVKYPTRIYANSRVGQLVFLRTGEVEKSYDQIETSKYKNQGADPQKAK